MLKFSSKAISEHEEVPLADEGRYEKLVAEWSERHPPRADDRGPSASYVVSVGPERDAIARAAQLAEILALVKSQGGHVVGHEISHLDEPNPRTLLGKGLAREIAA